MTKSDVKDCLEQGAGSSGSTCKSMIAWLCTFQPLLHFWENVPDIVASSNFQNLQWLMHALRKAGYACAYGKFRSINYGHPSKRERAYGVCLNASKLGLDMLQATHLAQKVIDFAQSVFGQVAGPVPLRSILLPDKSEWVQARLHQLQETKAKDLESKSLDTSWRKKTSGMCTAHGINYSTLVAPPKISGSDFYQALTTMQQHSIAFHIKANKDPVVSMDISQMVDRIKPSTSEEALDTVTPEGRIVLYSPLVPEFRCLVGYESMRLIGVPDEVLDEFKSFGHGLDLAAIDKLYYDLGGNAFSGGVILALIMSSLLHIDAEYWIRETPKKASSSSSKTEEVEVDDVDNFIF